MNGKGSKQRPTDLQKYRKNYDDIFLKKRPIEKKLKIYNKGDVNMITRIVSTIIGFFFSSNISVTILTGLVIDVIDGDTITIIVKKDPLKKGKVYKIRLYGIDTPEKEQGFYVESKETLQNMILGKYVTVNYNKKGIYGRIIGKVYYSNDYINYNLIKNGLAWHYKKYSSDSDLAMVEEQAKKNRVGIWSQDEPVAPWDWRKVKKKKPAINEYWISNKSKIRHNSSCKYYNNSNGRYTQKKEGTPCQICSKQKI